MYICTCHIHLHTCTCTCTCRQVNIFTFQTTVHTPKRPPQSSTPYRPMAPPPQLPPSSISPRRYSSTSCRTSPQLSCSPLLTSTPNSTLLPLTVLCGSTCILCVGLRDTGSSISRWWCGGQEGRRREGRVMMPSWRMMSSRNCSVLGERSTPTVQSSCESTCTCICAFSIIIIVYMCDMMSH